MRSNEPILFGAGDFVQGPGVLGQTGAVTAQYGSHALIVAGKTAWHKSQAVVEQSLIEAGVRYELYPFEGYCSEPNTDQIAEAARNAGADVVVGIGGGKCLDAAKWASDKVGVRVVTVPTSVATCAAYASLCVLYDDTGSTIKSVFIRREVGAVILDTHFIATDSPPRLFAAGIADALAKEPELYFSIQFSTDWEKSVLPDAAYEIAAFNMRRYFKQGLQALMDVKAKKVSVAVEDIACMNTALTGMVSGLASGGKQLAIAHTIYDCVCTHFKPQRAAFLHGEIVSIGLAVQMAVNGYEESRIEELVNFLKAIGTPVSLKEIEIDPTEENVGIILDYVYRNMNISDEKIKNLIEKHIKRIC